MSLSIIYKSLIFIYWFYGHIPKYHRIEIISNLQNPTFLHDFSVFEILNKVEMKEFEFEDQFSTLLLDHLTVKINCF